MRTLSVKAGSVALCTAGHEVATVNRDLYKGDTEYSSAFSEFRPFQTVPKKGDAVPLKCFCTAPWFSNRHLLFVREP